MKDSLNSYIKSCSVRSKNKSLSTAIKSKLTEINNLSSTLLNSYSNDLYGSSKKEKNYIEMSNLSTNKNIISRKSSKMGSLVHLIKNKKKPYILQDNLSFKKNYLIRKFILEKDRIKTAKLSLSNKSKLNNTKLERTKTSNKKILNLLLNYTKMNESANNNLFLTNISNGENSNSEYKSNFLNNNYKKALRVKMPKKSFKLNSMENKYHMNKKDFHLHFNSLIDNIIHNKELEFEKEKQKKTNNDLIFNNIYNKINQFNRKNIKRFYSCNKDSRRMNTTSNDKKKNIPHAYNNYLNKTKDAYNDMSKTFFDLKADITNDINYIKTQKIAVTEKEIKYERITNDVRKIKKDIGYIKPTNKLFNESSARFNFLLNKSEYLNKISSKIAYRHRYYLGEKYGFDAKKDLPKVNIDIDTESYLFKFKKNLPHS